LQNFNEKQIIDLLKQNSFPIEFFNKDYFNLKINDHRNYIVFIFQKSELRINLPIQFGSLIKLILEKVKDYKIQFNDLNYYPFNETISHHLSNIKLRNTHNLIMKNIILNYKNGISKDELYKILWPNDYEIHLNKIDTHLSNLKNFLHKEINYNLNYSTTNSIIKFDL